MIALKKTDAFHPPSRAFSKSRKSKKGREENPGATGIKTSTKKCKRGRRNAKQ
jgi:hypothetical protein